MKLFKFLVAFLALLLLIATPNFAQSELIAANHSLPVIKWGISESQNAALGAKGEERTVAIPIQLRIESEVNVEIIDALGRKKFQLETLYPEGDQEVKVRMGQMDQGLYFVRVTTDLDEISQVVIIERIP